VSTKVRPHQIEQTYKGKIAGIYVQDSPKYRMIVNLKGFGHNEVKEFKLKNVHKIFENEVPSDALILPVYFQYGALETREEGRSRAALEIAKISKQYNVQSASYDEEFGAVVIQIYSTNPKLDQANFDKVNPFKGQALPTKINFSDIRFLE
jgi:hypothetical protein